MDTIQHHRPFPSRRRRGEESRRLRRDITLEIALRRLDFPR
ncbi:hypothetical protein [Nocardioides hwasunensis]|nr:hypothetical protein [Nocardioides hwasunensis]